MSNVLRNARFIDPTDRVDGLAHVDRLLPVLDSEKQLWLLCGVLFACKEKAPVCRGVKSGVQ